MSALPAPFKTRVFLPDKKETGTVRQRMANDAQPVGRHLSGYRNSPRPASGRDPRHDVRRPAVNAEQCGALIILVVPGIDGVVHLR